MAVKVRKESQPRIRLKGANSSTVDDGILLGTGDGNRTSMTFTATAEPVIVIPEGPVTNVQLEAGSFATSYIPNNATSGTVTRSTDIASIPVSAFGYNQEAGTVVVEYMLYNTAFSAIRNLAQLDDETVGNRIVSQVNTAGKMKVFMNTAGSTQDNFGAEDVSEGVVNKTAMAFVENSTGLSTNGSATENGDGASVVPSVTTLRLGLHSNGNFPLNGHIKSIQYYPRRLTDAQLQTLTS